MSTIIPAEIEAKILVLLPAKSLQRFKAVCKSWHSLITSDAIFYASFYRRSLENYQLLLLKYPPRQSPTTPIHFSFASPRTLLETSSFQLPNTALEQRATIGDGDGGDDDQHVLIPTRIELINSNSINGIVGIVVYMGLPYGPLVNCQVYFWNVSTGETLKLPMSEITGLFDGPPMVKFYTGFGRGNRPGDFKLVRVVSVSSVSYVSEVFSLRRNRWMVVQSGSVIPSNTLWASEMCTFVNGVGYWGVFSSESKDRFYILGFDFRADNFQRIEVPEDCVDGGVKKYQSLWEYKGQLAISVLHFGEFESSSARHYIFVLRACAESPSGYVLSKLFDIDLDCGPRRPVATLDSGELVCFGEDDGEHVLYDHVVGRVRRLGIRDVDAVVPYTESLVSLRPLLPLQQQAEISSTS